MPPTTLLACSIPIIVSQRTKPLSSAWLGDAIATRSNAPTADVVSVFIIVPPLKYLQQARPRAGPGLTTLQPAAGLAASTTLGGAGGGVFRAGCEVMRNHARLCGPGCE